MIVKKNFNPIKVFSYIKYEMIYTSILAATVYYLHTNLLTEKISIPFSIAGLLGGALAIFLGFRNNTSYARWWEARQLWSNIASSSRILARLILTFTDSHSHQQNYVKERSELFKKEMIYKQIAWVHSLRLNLRKENSWEEIKPLLPESEWTQLQTKTNKTGFIQFLMGQRIYKAMADGTLGGFDSFQMEGQLLSLSNYQSGCERIKDTPLLKQYDFFTRVFLVVFISVLPFTLLSELQRLNVIYLLIPITILISFVFTIVGKVGKVNEDPFENKITDVPLNSICNSIELELREMLEDKNLPKKIEPVDGYLN